MPPAPPLFRLADLLLDGGLVDFLREQRAADVSWDTIAKELWARTDRQVDVSGPTVQAWFKAHVETDANGDTAA